ncbi:non-ribosomal peptide synthetase, partial [Streptomyces lunaelactis]|uniref:non-ribosomal peptide synthetase n=4 Tax=Streptomyces TaxID=1883 RepID=UPI0015855326
DSPLAEPAVQYADFAAWQRQWLRGDVLDSHLAYWRDQLAQAPTLLELPTDRPRPAVQSFRGSSERFVVDPAVRRGLEDLSRRAGVTLFMTLEAAFATTLARHSGQTDIVIGTPIANRTHPTLEPLIGYFATTTVLRTDVGSNPTFFDLLEQTRSVAMGAYAHHDVPFEKLVEELQPQRSLSHNPLFQVLFALQNVPAQQLSLGDAEASGFELGRQSVRSDMEMHVFEDGEGLRGRLIYNTDLFDQSTITRFIGHYQAVLASVAADAQQKISAIDLLSDRERHQLLSEFNDTAADYPDQHCLHDLFEEQVQRSPDAIAVEFESSRLTYRELNERANQVAHHLQKQGVRPDVLVGLCVPRSLEMLIGLLAILKAGGAYVPLDPTYPRERLAFMLADAQVPIVLSHSAVAGQLPTSLPTLLLDTEHPTNQPTHNPHPTTQPDH